MVRLIVNISLVLITLFPLMVVDAQEITGSSGGQVVILSPQTGQALQGTIIIIGENKLEDALRIELSFSYAENSRDTWFLICRGSAIVRAASGGIEYQMTRANEAFKFTMCVSKLFKGASYRTANSK